MGKKLEWPIGEDMLGKKVVFKGYLNGHSHWSYKVGQEYIIGCDLDGDIGPIIDDYYAPPKNYDNTFHFELIEDKQESTVLQGFKIRIPCDEVSKLVQEKAFSEGYYWVHSKQEKVILPSIHYLFLKEDGRITYVSACGSDYFSKKDIPEISWQEYLYGEGWFFKAAGNDKIFFQAKKDNTAYWAYVCGGVGKTTYNLYGPEHYKTWTPCDMHGNPLTIKQEENIMKQELNYTIPWKVKYNNEAELNAMREVFKGLGCELFNDLEECDWDFVCCHGGREFLEQCSHGNVRSAVDLLTAITHLLTPVKSKEELEREDKIAELEDTINKAQLEVEKASQQIRELKGE